MEASQRKCVWVVLSLHSALAAGVFAYLHHTWGPAPSGDDAVLWFMVLIDFPSSMALFFYSVAQIDAPPIYFNNVVCTSLIIFVLGGLQWYLVTRLVVHHLNAKRDSSACIGCGYNLTGNVSGVCPECGTAI